MNAIELLREQLKSAHETLDATMAEVTEEVAHFANTNKAMPVGAAYAHAVLAEDIVVATMLAQTQPLSAAKQDIGLSEPMPPFAQWDKHEQWMQTVKVDLPKLQAFAKEVYEATDKYFATLTEMDLDKEIEVHGMGTQKLVFVINNFVILHIANLTGEISSVKGLQGLKGYPF